MKKQFKEKQTLLISRFLSTNKIENELINSEDECTIEIKVSDIPEKGFHHEIVRFVINTSTFKSMTVEENTIKFKFDISPKPGEFDDP